MRYILGAVLFLAVQSTAGYGAETLGQEKCACGCGCSVGCSCGCLELGPSSCACYVQTEH